MNHKLGQAASSKARNVAGSVVANASGGCVLVVPFRRNVVGGVRRIFSEFAGLRTKKKNF